MLKVTMPELERANPIYFADGKKEFFGDILYKTHEHAGRSYLVTLTYGFSDMFGNRKRSHYRITPILSDKTLGDLIDQQFKNLKEVTTYLNNYT